MYLLTWACMSWYLCLKFFWSVLPRTCTWLVILFHHLMLTIYLSSDICCMRHVESAQPVRFLQVNCKSEIFTSLCKVEGNESLNASLWYLEHNTDGNWYGKRTTDNNSILLCTTAISYFPFKWFDVLSVSYIWNTQAWMPSCFSKA